MHKIYLFLFLCLSTHLSLAQTQLLFAKDGSKATVFMLAVSSNPDAIAFNKVLNLPATEGNGKFTKKTSFIDSQGNKPLDIACAFSAVAVDTGSCFVTFRPVGNVILNKTENAISFFAENEDATNLINLFFYEPLNPNIFTSPDGKLQIFAEYQAETLKKLWITYGFNN